MFFFQFPLVLRIYKYFDYIGEQFKNDKAVGFLRANEPISLKFNLQFFFFAEKFSCIPKRIPLLTVINYSSVCVGMHICVLYLKNSFWYFNLITAIENLRFFI